MSQFRNRSFIGGGRISIRQLSTTPGVKYPSFPFGNADSFSFAINEDKKTQRNFQTPGGGNIASQSSITDVTATINALSFQPNVLATALRSLVKLVPGGAVAAEDLTVFKLGSEQLAKVPDTAQAITITDATATTTYVAGTDYIIQGTSIFIPENSAITASDTNNQGVAVKVTYTSLETYEIEAITQASIEYELTFDGFNDADNGKPTIVKCHRIKFSPTQALDLISEDFAALPINFEVLADDSIIASDESKYFKVKMVS